MSIAGVPIRDLTTAGSLHRIFPSWARIGRTKRQSLLLSTISAYRDGVGQWDKTMYVLCSQEVTRPTRFWDKGTWDSGTKRHMSCILNGLRVPLGFWDKGQHPGALGKTP